MKLPTEVELRALYTRLNVEHFASRLPEAVITWSTRMRSSAGICYPTRRLIRLSVRYCETYPQDLVPVLLHEMIHLLHPDHGRAFKAEAARVGALLHARPTSAAEQRPWRWFAQCPHCSRHWLYRNRRKLFCRHCRDWRGRHPALEFRRLPGSPRSAAEATRLVARVMGEKHAVPERMRQSGGSAHKLQVSYNVERHRHGNRQSRRGEPTGKDAENRPKTYRFDALQHPDTKNRPDNRL